MTITVNRSGGVGQWGGGQLRDEQRDGDGGQRLYTSTSGTLTFAGGETSKTFTVPITNDSLVEGNETFNVALSSATGGGAPGSPSSGSDHRGRRAVPQLTIGTPAAITEGDTGSKNLTFTVTLSASSSQTVTVNYATSNGTATAGSDYTSTSGTLTFNPGVTSQPINVPILGDYVIEGNETFTVTLSGAANATIGTGTATPTIQDDDMAGTLPLSSATYSVNENGVGC